MLVKRQEFIYETSYYRCSPEPEEPEPAEDNSEMGAPLPGTKDAPKFDEKEPLELMRFFERMEDLFENHPTQFATDKQKIQALGKYASARTEMEWRAFDTYSKEKYEDYKRDILDSYPEARKLERGSLDTLQTICDSYRRNPIASDDLPGLAGLIRAFRAEAKKLLKEPPLVSNRDLVDRFVRCLTEDFQVQIDARLGLMTFAKDKLAKSAEAPAAGAAKETHVRPEDLYQLDDVIETAQNVAETSRKGTLMDYSRSTGGRSYQTRELVPDRPGSEALVKMEEKIAMLTDTLINAEKRQTQRDQQLQELQKNIASMKQTLVANQQVAPAMPYAPAPMPYPQYQQRLPRNPGFGTQGNGCFYCQETGHMLNSCPHALKHLDAKWIIKNEEGRIRLPNGGQVPNNVGGSMKETVEQLHKNRPGIIPAAKVPSAAGFYQDSDESPLVQAHYQLANDYNLTSNLMHLVREYGADAVERILRNEAQSPAYDPDPVMGFPAPESRKEARFDQNPVTEEIEAESEDDEEDHPVRESSAKKNKKSDEPSVSEAPKRAVELPYVAVPPLPYVARPATDASTAREDVSRPGPSYRTRAPVEEGADPEAVLEEIMDISQKEYIENP
ncbi:hypothetical protein D9613_012930 [Agrocybe pediades]|uniref:CCHC-type domain-containing protein n=1 Tax=Agrocybe pediades TaxID=84607 RepID=A0A8H4VHM9_9AGAR|nr:hypothetical protein D9613_012930 [Agrocybe pediades]